MNPLLSTAALLATAVAIAHSYLGERYVLTRLFRRTDLPRLFGSDWFTRRTLRFAWHLTSVAWLGFAALFVVLAQGSTPSRAHLLYASAAMFGISALTTAAATRGRHLAWIIFLAIAVLAFASA